MTVEQLKAAQTRAMEKADSYLRPVPNFTLAARYDQISALLEIALQLAIANERNENGTA